jgi:NADH-quinone oxidoreductase subunit I
MTKVYDFSVFDIREHNFIFGEMEETEIAAKKKALEDHQKSKQAAAVQPVSTTPVSTTEEKKEISDTPKPSKPVFRPKIKPAGPPPGAS